MFDFEIDAETSSLIQRVAPFTMTTPERLVALKEAVEYIGKFNILGSIVECGVWRGGSMMLVALTMLRLGDCRQIFLYDTFEGMPQSGPRDFLWTGQAADVPVGSWKVDVDEVQANMASTGYDMRLCHCVPGLVEETLHQEAPLAIGLLRLDTDWYESTKCELEVLYPRLAPGGVLIIDDYGHWLGARKATDEYFARIGEPILLHRIDYTCRVAVKPRRAAGSVRNV